MTAFGFLSIYAVAAIAVPFAGSNEKESNGFVCYFNCRYAAAACTAYPQQALRKFATTSSSTVSHLFNCKENIALKRTFPTDFLQKGRFNTMLALKKALTWNK